MGKHTNTSNAFYSSYRISDLIVANEKENARRKRHYKKYENGDISVTPEQHKCLIILWNLAKRHEIPCSEEFKHPNERFSASQNIRVMSGRIGDKIGYQVFKKEYAVYERAYIRKHEQKARTDESKVE